MIKFSLILLALISMRGMAGESKVIYGEDNRRDVFDSDNGEYVHWSKSTAAMIANYKLEVLRDGSIIPKGYTMAQYGYCRDERFSDQKMSARCSGFLVGEDILVTAGHCLKSSRDCANYSWVFGFQANADGTPIRLDKKDVYKCKKVLDTQLSYSTMNDYTVIQLERKTDRPYLEMRSSGQISKGDNLVVIGHPVGLPTKIADGAWVRKNSHENYFVANLDTYGGNSGSAVINTQSGLVEGILVRGESDFTRAPGKNCLTSRRCDNSSCRGEDVTRITSIKYFQ